MRQKWDSSEVKNMIVMRLAVETKKKLGWNSQNDLRTTYDHYFVRGALSQKRLCQFRSAFCSYCTPVL